MTSGSGRASEFRVQFRAPTLEASDDIEGSASQDWQTHEPLSSSRSPTRVKRRPASLRLEHRSHSPSGPLTPSIYHGSYGKAGKGKKASWRGSVDGRTPYGSAAPSPRTSASHVQLQHLLHAVDVETDTYGLYELRDGFFDASFDRPWRRDSGLKDARESLPAAFRKHHPLSLRFFLTHQWHEFCGFLESLRKSSSGLKLLKSFLSVFIAYIICLIPASRDWLGRYNYVIVISALLNHSGRSVGSQLDGMLLSTLGAVAGLGWGALALYVSTSTGPARSGYGGILAAFLILFTAAIAWLRCVFMRFYQAILCAGIAICYTCLADTSEAVSWRKLFNYGIPWVLGQALSLLAAVFVVPDTGSRSLALAFHDALQIVERGLTLPHEEDLSLRRDLGWTFAKLSGAVRDFTIDLSISRYNPDDVRSVRNLMQGVIRGVLSIRPETILFEPVNGIATDPAADLEASLRNQFTNDEAPDSSKTYLELICQAFAAPTRDLIEAMVGCIKDSDQILTRMGGVTKFSNNSAYLETLPQSLQHLKDTVHAFDAADARLIKDVDLSSGLANHPEIVDILLFVHPVRQAADKVKVFADKALEMQLRQQHRKGAVNLPSYPFVKSLDRVNAQVRHDRGGLTAGFYFRTKQQLEKSMADLQSSSYVPRPRSIAVDGSTETQASETEDSVHNKGAIERVKEEESSRKPFRYNVWRFLHRFQDFETRFALKVALTTTLISIPAWLQQSRGWWNTYDSWWAVVTIWVMMHPRVGGTFQDLFVRSFYAALGALWAGLAYGAGNGNPYVLAVFAALFMIPMLHRFTQSSHPRSGIMGCLSFSVISLGAYTDQAQPSITTFAWTRGLAFVVGVVAALLVNWILWPFVARHELRKSLSTMLLHSAILYRSVVAKYIYYDAKSAPTASDIERSEMLEGRLREGFVRIRQLLELTRHEIRLRAPFDPLPYSALIDACERLFENLVEVRQSSLYFQPYMHARSDALVDTLFEVRRDAVAVILLNLYSLACALRSGISVPRYLPSAAAARQRLLDRMDEVEMQREEREHADSGGGKEVEGLERGERQEKAKGRRWADVYQYAFSKALTDIVEELQKLQQCTKEIVGESVWDCEGG